MPTNATQQEKVRVQVDLNPVEAARLELLQRRLSVRSRADLLQQAYGSFMWIVSEMLSGRRIVSLEPAMLGQLERFKELSVPAVEPMVFRHYRFLKERLETGRKQFYLVGRNMTVGQLIYKMRANQLNAQEAAADMDLPLEQVMEALIYYQTHRDLVESEMDEEGNQLRSLGVDLESGVVSG